MTPWAPAPGVPERATMTELGHSARDTDHYRSVSHLYYQESPPEVEVPPTDNEMQVSNPCDPPQSVGLDWPWVTMRNWPWGMHIDPGQGHIPHHATDEDGDTL